MHHLFWILEAQLPLMAITADGTVYLLTDNNGLDDTMGGTQFIRLENLAE